jgi:hypothetical protein
LAAVRRLLFGVVDFASKWHMNWHWFLVCFSIHFDSPFDSSQDEVQNRRDEFARLLDEHEQVVRELRRIESSSEIQITDQNGHNPAESPEASPTSDSSDQQATSQQEE